jgi:hypothetical protein
MSPASFTPEQALHSVLCDFGRSGQAYVETDLTQADASTIVRNLLATCSGPGAQCGGRLGPRRVAHSPI